MVDGQECCKFAKVDGVVSTWGLELILRVETVIMVHWKMFMAHWVSQVICVVSREIKGPSQSETLQFLTGKKLYV